MNPERLGPYKIDKLLGRGGMGSVYAGIHETSGEPAAVKVLAAQYADEPHFRGRFAIEVETLKKLDHPNIVSMFGFGEEGDQLFYAMELVNGENLFEAVRGGREFSVAEVVRIGEQICLALRHAHDRGIVHRDLKPANLMLDEQNNIKLTDFGIAKLFGSTQMTAAGGVLGTADYMAPEQAEGKAATVRSDLYSLGSVLFALLARRAPFAAKSLPEVLHKLRYEEAPPIQKFAPDTPTRLGKLISRLLEKDPQRRIGTAVAVSKRLQETAQELRDAEPPPSSTSPPASNLTRHSTREDDDFTLSEQSGSPSTDTPKTEWSRPTAPDPPQPKIPGREKSKPADATTAIPLTQVSQTNLQDNPGDHLKTAVSSGSAPTSHQRAQATGAKRSAAGHRTSSPQAAKEPAAVYTPIEEARREEKPASEPVGQATMGFIGLGLLGIIVVAATIYFVIPPSASTLYAKIETAAEATDARELLGVQLEMDQFLRRFPNDERAKEVQGYLDEAKAIRSRRRFEADARKAKRSHTSDPAESFYLAAIELSEEDPQGAVDQLQALIDLFAGQPDPTQKTKNLLEVAEKEIARLEIRIKANQQRDREFIESRFADAKAIEPTDPVGARKIWRGIVSLYEENAAVRDLVAEAKRELSRTDQ
ncbi:MAG: protein kinase [bacterium]|nr:protein kinase [bacterium]